MAGATNTDKLYRIQNENDFLLIKTMSRKSTIPRLSAIAAGATNTDQLHRIQKENEILFHQGDEHETHRSIVKTLAWFRNPSQNNVHRFRGHDVNPTTFISEICTTEIPIRRRRPRISASSRLNMHAGPNANSGSTMGRGGEIRRLK